MLLFEQGGERHGDHHFRNIRIYQKAPCRDLCRGIINEHPAAKKDLAELEAALKRDIAALQACLKRDIPELEQSMDMRFKEVEYKLTIRPGAMMAASVAMVAALVKLL